VWEKHIAVGFLNCNKAPLRSHEMIYIFNNNNNNNNNVDDIYIEFNLELREYAREVLKIIDKPYSKIQKELGHMRLCHFWTVIHLLNFLNLLIEHMMNSLINLR
jgi:hypothetical protein